MIDELARIQLDATSLSLIQDVRQLSDEVRNLRPLDEDVLATLRKEILGERVFNSNSIEGNTLTRRETTAILETGQLVDVGKERESLEVINLRKAIDLTQRFFEQSPNATRLAALERIGDLDDPRWRVSFGSSATSILLRPLSNSSNRSWQVDCWATDNVFGANAYLAPFRCSGSSSYRGYRQLSPLTRQSSG